MADAKSSKKRTYEEILASTKAIVAEKHRKRVEVAAQPGETFAEAESRLSLRGSWVTTKTIADLHVISL